MKVTPKTDEELQIMNLIPPGQYPFEVFDAIDKTSKSGNEMIELVIKVWDHNNHERIIYDYLLDSMPHKIKHFCKISGLEDSYNAGALLAKDCIGKSGYLDLIIQKDKTGIYGDKNSVKDYVAKENSTAPTRDSDVFNDELPF